jgi:hypothetical protein
MQKTWFKAFIWTVSTAFFFLASATVISALGPGPDEQQVMLFMSGMMNAMNNSLMGLSMTLEGDYELRRMISGAAAFTIPAILTGAAAGLYFRFKREKRNAG